MPEERVTIEQVAELLDVNLTPPLDPSDVQALHKALPGYQAMVDDTASLVLGHNETLRLSPEVMADLNQGLAEVKRLEPIEYLLDELQQSVYHQRLQATSRCMEGLYKSSRRIREFKNAYPEIRSQAQYLFDFLKAFRPGPKRDKPSNGTGNG
ncbi:MAG: hypothetical protein WGN25_01095 [Candidatus Electrothrix sp. GW3-4]|uniref:hypothetical protein n=1 Tax=Candidatus Electrothrix sp. GW3-4 TaxID=3126740 RepID=UPI0030D0B00D